MIRLTSTNDVLELSLADAVASDELEIVVCFSDHTATNYIGDAQASLSDGASDVEIVSAPDADTIRDIDFISVYNADSVPAVVTIKIDVSSVESVLGTWTLQPGDTLFYTHSGGWSVVGADGSTRLAISLQEAFQRSWFGF